MIGAEEKISVPFVDAERPPTAAELELWRTARELASRVNLLSYLLKNQWAQIKLEHDFAVSHKIVLGEPDLPDTGQRMFSLLREAEQLKDAVCGVEQLELGIRLTPDGKDLDIVQPRTVELSGDWVTVFKTVVGTIPIANVLTKALSWEIEAREISAKYDGVIERADRRLCSDPSSSTCQEWQTTKAEGGFEKRSGIIDSLKAAASKVITVAKSSFKWGIALAIPLLIWLYAPRKRSS